MSLNSYKTAKYHMLQLFIREKVYIHQKLINNSKNALTAILSLFF